jgi:type I restriction enzyme, S subunit
LTKAASIGKVAIVDTDANFNVWSPLAILRPDPALLDSRFLYFALQAAAARDQLETSSTKNTQQNVAMSDIGALRISNPLLATQCTIADYLDRETARIDALIAAKQRMAELLEERLRVAISNATTEGQPTALRRVIVLRTTGPRGWGDLVAESGDPFIRSANLRRDDIELQIREIALVTAPVSEEAARSRTRPGDVLVGVTGANTGWVGIVRRNVAHGFVSQHVAILRPAGVLLPEWLAYSLFSSRVQEQLLGGQYGGTKQQLGLEDLAELVIRMPDLQRQSALIDKLECTKMASRNAVATLSAQIGLLHERRQALITAAVIGQLDIAGAA